MPRKITSVVVLVLLVLSAVHSRAAAEEPKLDLRPKLSVNQENVFIVDMHSKTQTRFLDRPRVRLQEYQQRIRVRRKVLEVSESGATIEVKYEAAAVNLVAGDKVLSFDSEGINSPEPDQTIGPSVRNALNIPFIVKVDSNGKVLSVSGNTQDGTKLAASNLIGTEVLGEAMGPIYGLDKDPSTAAIGQVWVTTSAGRPTESGIITTKTTSKLQGVSGDRATIGMSGELSLEPSEKAKAGKASITGYSVAGEYTWNILGGVIDRSAYRRSMKLEADVEGRGPLQEKGEIRRKEAESMVQVIVTRVDEGIEPLPPLPAELAPTPVTSPGEKPAPIVEPGKTPAAPADGQPAEH